MWFSSKGHSPTSAKKKPSKNHEYGWSLTLGLWFILILVVCCLWALFISGPARLHEAQLAQVKETIQSQVPAIQGLQQTAFEYVTWQGYTNELIYWFDATGNLITTKELSTLDYNEARERAREDYGMEARVVFVAYGYSGPVYQLENNVRLLMLDYDTLDWVYERSLTYGTK